jgi:hypothetical protein
MRHGRSFALLVFLLHSPLHWLWAKDDADYALNVKQGSKFGRTISAHRSLWITSSSVLMCASVSLVVVDYH